MADLWFGLDASGFEKAGSFFRALVTTALDCSCVFPSMNERHVAAGDFHPFFGPPLVVSGSQASNPGQLLTFHARCSIRRCMLAVPTHYF